MFGWKITLENIQLKQKVNYWFKWYIPYLLHCLKKLLFVDILWDYSLGVFETNYFFEDFVSSLLVCDGFKQVQEVNTILHKYIYLWKQFSCVMTVRKAYNSVTGY